MSGYKYGNTSNRLRARALLKQVLPEASKEAERMLTSDQHEAETSPLFDALAVHLTEDKITELHIYPAPNGGWHADLKFEGLPAGITQIAGTPKTMPCETRQEALHQGKIILAMLLATIRKRKAGPHVPSEDGDAPFIFDGVALYVPIKILEFLKATAVTPNPEYVEKRLGELKKELAKEGRVRVEDVRSLGQDDLARVHAIAAMALLAGIPRWPETVDVGLPSTMKH